MKKWRDAGEVLKMIHELPADLREMDKLMREKPGFNKKGEKKNMSVKKHQNR